MRSDVRCLWVIWFWLLITVFADVFRRRHIGGGAKTLWIMFVIVLPFLGVFVYLISQHDKMADRNTEQARASQAQADDYIRSVAGNGGGPAAEIDKAKQLLDCGAITETEFDAFVQGARRDQGDVFVRAGLRAQ